MVSGIQAALSALQAYATKLNSNANNIANMNTDGFKKSRVTLGETAPAGVSARVERDQSPGPVVYQETGTGLVPAEQSNVDIGEEFPAMISGSNAYEANLKSLKVQEEMFRSVLDLKA